MVSQQQDPIGYFLTWTTYGTWLPGDERGWVEYKNGWQMPAKILEIDCQQRMREAKCLLTPTERILVEQQVKETCRLRKWTLYAINCRSNHLHVVLDAELDSPEKIRIDLKAWTTRRLQEESGKQRKHWWAERGSSRYIWDEESLNEVVHYVDHCQ